MLIYFDLCKMTPQDFATRTREDRQQFDSIRETAFIQKAQEIADHEAQTQATRLQVVTNKLATIWMSVPEKLTKAWVVTFMTNINAKQWVWEDIQRYLQWQLELHWSYKKVIEYLVLTYL